MALSNIFREPGREIVESAVGLTAFGGFIWLDYWIASGFQDRNPGEDIFECMFLTFMALLFLLPVLVVILWVTHAIGEGICNMLEARGVQMRPRNGPWGRT